ncbi:tyrosine-type recombinase/integrase, partial [Tautonia marina]|uniref:tyrosine-type recombinase/integrase n=1 Tax=Tautonia marina TaxID=2653855 RepID=UPI001260B3A3
MASLGRKGDLYVARFRHDGKEFKKSLRTTRLADARAAMHGVERILHGLTTGLIRVPDGVDPGDFIVSGGTVEAPHRARRRAPSVQALFEEYLGSQTHKAPSSLYTERIHLRNLIKHLGPRSEAPVDRIAHRDLERFLQVRLRERSSSTVHKERDTIVQFFRWVTAQGHLDSSPASGLTPIKEELELPPFRTTGEIEAILRRGGLSPEEQGKIWDCLFLAPSEIAELLALIRERARDDFGYLLHAVPAYTGMRRGEVLRLRWTDVEFDSGSLIARSRKQSRRAVESTRRIDLHPELRDELLAWRDRRPRGQFVISEAEALEVLSSDRANRAFWQPMRGTSWCLDSRRNWFKIGFHTYRHSFASNLAARGVDQRIIDEFMGHQTEAMRKRYRH